MNIKDKKEKLHLSNSGLSPTNEILAFNHLGENVNVKVAGELPLTIKIDGEELITLMTLGTRPEELTLGYLRNQGLIDSIDDIISVDVKWDIGISEVITKNKNTKQILKKLEKKQLQLVVAKEQFLGALLKNYMKIHFLKLKLKSQKYLTF